MRPATAWLLVLVLGGFARTQEGPVVMVAGGKVRGETIREKGRSIDVFRGIPFAAAPVGELRWRPPQAVRPWEGVRECRRFAPACPQPADLVYAMRFGEQSEDCLYLNVWSPAEKNGKVPVMVWIHGGGNVIGGAGTPVYDGRHFAAEGVVLVSIQYRLGPFGYLAHPALSEEAKRLDGRAVSGNYGLLDQVAALTWVRDHIEKFGGDPQRVTIFGESAGAANVTYLMAAPGAKGLFHRAIAQSGYFGENVANLREKSGKLVSGHQQGLDYAGQLKVTERGEEGVKALRKKTAKELLGVPMTVGPGKGFRFGPMVDGEVLPRDPWEVWAEGKMHRVPFIAGSNLDDGSVFSRGLPIKKMLGYRFALRALFGPDAAEAGRVFAAAKDEEVFPQVHRITTMVSFRAPARRLVRWMDGAGGKAWLYHFTRNPGVGRAAREGVFHGLEIGYVFGTLTKFGGEVDRQLGQDMRQRWIALARTGDPNGGKKVHPTWPGYRTKEDRHLDFGERVQVGSGLDRAACDLVDRSAERRRK